MSKVPPPELRAPITISEMLLMIQQKDELMKALRLAVEALERVAPLLAAHEQRVDLGPLRKQCEVLRRLYPAVTE